MLPTGPAALIVSHPGHELRVYGWMTCVRPWVFVLTDGSGRSARSRLDSTRRVLAETSARPGSIFGRFTDRQVYEAILRHHFDLFYRLTDELAHILACRQVAYVVGDAAEGYNPTHDVCRAVIDAAVALVHRDTEQRPQNFDFTLVGMPDAGVDDRPGDFVQLHLTDAMFQRKVLRAFRYPELAQEVQLALRCQPDTLGRRPMSPELRLPLGETPGITGLQAFQVEYLRHIKTAARVADSADAPPFYELYGEQQVAAGHYHEVIRYQQHVQPLLKALQHHTGLTQP